MQNNDLILKMIEDLGKNIGKAIFDVKEDLDPIMLENLSDKDILLIMLKKMIYDKKYNEAENTLFEFAENNNCDEVIEIGKWFYAKLDSKSDNELLQNNFSRYEINQGLKDFILKFTTRTTFSF